MQITLRYGSRTVRLDVRDADLLPLERPPASPGVSAETALRDALERPVRYAPLRQALTPDDRVTVVLDEGLPSLVPLLVGVLGQITDAGVRPEAITVLTPPGAGRQDWLDDLPDDYQDVRVEVHDPADRSRLAYLMSTKAGRRVYLNRTAAEADLTVLLTGVGYDPILGHGGGPGALFPALADTDALAELAGKLSFDGPGPATRAVSREADEVAAEVNPFLVQVIEDEGDAVYRVVCGLADSAADARRTQDARWRRRLSQRADTVVGTLTGDPARHDFAALARAFACGARIVNPDGRIVLLTDAAPDLPPAAALLRGCDDPAEALERLAAERPVGHSAAFLWATAASRASLFLVSRLDGSLVEELFAAPLDRAEYTQRLLDAPGACAILPDAHKTLAEVGRTP